MNAVDWRILTLATYIAVMFKTVRTLLTSVVLCAALASPAELAEGDDMIALSFHVDYWNYIGWNGPFSSAEVTARQRAYGRTMKKRYV